jgi:hypothetical protein
MAETRVCHICETVVGKREFCPRCIAWVDTLPDPHTMTPDERAAEMELWGGVLEIPFHKVHARIEALAGRPVWTHELAESNFARLLEDVRNNTGVSPVSYDEALTRAIDAIPAHLRGKTIMVDDDSAQMLEDWDVDVPDAFKGAA